jgi:glycosyltransferase involved in cell wall biosynthesis
LRVLALSRLARGGGYETVRALAALLDPLGIEVVVDDAAWIPNETGFQADKTVTKRLKEDAKGFDLVLAVDYRAAWACAEAFYLRRPWAYLAWGMPKTTLPDLIDRLCSARLGWCPSHAVRTALEGADCVHLETLLPPVAVPEVGPGRDGARQELGLPVETPIFLGLGRFVPDRGFDDLVAGFSEVALHRPDAALALVGEGQPPRADDHRVLVRQEWDAERRWLWLRAADLLVVPSLRAGFSLAAAQAALLGTPVALRRAGGLEEQLGPEGAWRFSNRSDMPGVLLEALSHDVATLAKADVRERCDPERFARQAHSLLRLAVGG